MSEPTVAAGGRAAGAARSRLFRTAAVGVLAGFLSGLFGVGGGILIVPGLVLLMGMEQRRAHGTSLAAIIPIAAAGVGGYALDDAVDWPVAGLLAAGAAAGALIGTHALQRTRQDTLRRLFALFLVLMAVRLLFEVGTAAGRSPLDAGSALALAGLGLVAGTLAGLFGVGGGIIMVPAMVILFSIPSAVAKGTSLVVILPTALTGTARNLKHGNADLAIAAQVGVLGVASAFAATRLSIHMSERLSSILFAALLVILGVRMLLERRAEPEA